MGKYCLFFLFIFLHPIPDCLGQKDTTIALDIAGLSLENPIGLGGFFGTACIGIAGQNRTRSAENRASGGRNADANAGIYVGLGDPVKYIGIGTSLGIYGLSGAHGTSGNLGESGLNIDVSKLLFKILFVKAGIDNVAFWGVTKESISAQKSYYGAGTIFLVSKNKKLGAAYSYIAVTVGAGNGLYRRDKDFTPVSSGYFNPFFSIAVPVFYKTNAIVEWTGYDISTGISTVVKLSKKQSFGVNLEIADYLLGCPRLALSIAYSFSYINNRYHEIKK